MNGKPRTMNDEQKPLRLDASRLSLRPELCRRMNGKSSTGDPCLVHSFAVHRSMFIVYRTFLGRAQDLRLSVRDGNGMFKMGGAFPIGCHNRPAVR